MHVVVQAHGTRVGVRGTSVRISEADGRVLRELPLVNLETLSLLGSVQVSTQAIHVLAERGVPIAFLSAAGRLVAMLDPLDSVSADVRRAQVRGFDQPATRLDMARALIAAKIANQRTLLMRNHPALASGVVRSMADLVAAATSASSTDGLRGIEGHAAALYFRHFGDMVPGDLGREFAAHGRQRRPAPDPINSVLSLGYTMLTHESVAALRLASLEPTVAAFHVSRPGRPALALDLMEPFRPLVADSVALATFNRGELGEGHFYRTAAGCVLNDAGRRAFFAAYARRMDTEVTHPAFGYRLSYRRMVVLHARLIAAWLLGEVPGLTFLTTR